MDSGRYFGRTTRMLRYAISQAREGKFVSCRFHTHKFAMEMRLRAIKICEQYGYSYGANISTTVSFPDKRGFISFCDFDMARCMPVDVALVDHYVHEQKINELQARIDKQEELCQEYCWKHFQLPVTDKPFPKINWEEIFP